MQASVYRLRQHGIKLPRPQPFVAGELLLTKVLDAANRSTLKAQLLTGTGTLALPPLEHARVTRISRNGIAIAGPTKEQQGIRGPLASNLVPGDHPSTRN
jgi:hypothetical protein